MTHTSLTPISLTAAVDVRSGLAQDLMTYYRRLIARLDRTPWFHGSAPITARAIAVPSRVYRQESDEEKSRRIAERDGRDDSFSDVDRALLAVYEEATRGGEIVEWRQQQRRERRAVILGGPGSGKSMLAALTGLEAAQAALDRLAARRVALDAAPAVVHIKLPDLAKSGHEALHDALATLLQMPDYGASSARAAGWLATRVAQRDGLLLLDGLDEVNAALHPRLKTLLAQVETHSWQSRVFLTCRRANYARGLIPWRTLAEIELAPLRVHPDVRSFLRNWFGAGDSRGDELLRRLQGNFSLRHAARSPLVLTLMCVAHEDSPLGEGVRRADLYGLVLRALLRRIWKDDPSPPNDLHVDDLMGLLEEMAWTLFARQSEANQFSNSAVVAAIGAAPSRPLPHVLQQAGYAPEVLAQAPILLRDELRAASVLVDAGLNHRGEAQMSFGHRTFLEYLVACALARRAEAGEWCAVWDEVEAHLWTPGWQEVITFLGGALEDAAPLVAALLSCGDCDPFHHRHLLAAKVIGEAGAQEMDDSLVQPLARYIALVLRSASEEDSARAADGLAALGEGARPYLRAALQNADSHIRGAAVLGIAHIGEAGLSDLRTALQNKHWWVRSTAVDGLGQMGEVALPELRAALQDGDWEVRRAAVRGLGQMGEITLPQLRAALQDKDWRVSHAAVKELVQMGEAAMADLRIALQHKDSDVRREALKGLIRMGAGTLPELSTALHDADEDVARAAAEGLVQMGEAALPDLRTALQDDGEVTEAVIWEIARAGEGALPELRTALQDVEGWWPLWAKLESGARFDKAALPELRAALQDDWYRSAALKALVQMGEATLPELRAALQDVDELVQLVAVEGLAQMGEAALPDLRAALQDENEDVGRAAAEVMRAIAAGSCFAAVTAALLEAWSTFRDHACEAAYPILLQLAWRHQSVEPLRPIAQEATNLMLRRQ